MSLIHGIKDWLPPRLLNVARRFSGRALRFSGHPKSWIDAQNLSTGYLEGSILERVAEATRQVVAGKAAYERDAVVFGSHEYSYPLMAVLLHAAAMNQGKLNVVDFGGSLGSTYRQCRPFLKGLVQVSWQVVEQTNFVELGKREFETDELSFYSSVSQLPASSYGSRVLLLSSVLQYLESPLKMLDELKQFPFSHILIDRTPVSEHQENRLCVQKVPANIYEASYPCWILAKTQLLDLFSADWTELCEFPCLDGKWATDDGLDFEFRGFCFLPKSDS